MMTRTFAAIAACLLVFGGPPLMGRSPSPPGDGGKNTVWVTNRDADQVTVFDAVSGNIRRTIGVRRGAHDIVISRSAGKAYVMNELDHSVSVYSARTFGQLENFALGPLPHHAEISHDGRTVYVGLFGTNRVATIDTSTEAVREYVSSPSSAARAHAPHPSEDGRFIFVPHEQGTSELTTIDAETGDIVMNVIPGSGPSEVLPARGGKLYASIRNEDKVRVIDRATGALEWDLFVGDQPEVLMLAPNERTLVVTLRGTPAQVVFVDTVAHEVIKTVPLVEGDGTGTNGDLGVMSHDRRFVYATFDRGMNGFGGVAVIDVKTMERVATWDYPVKGRPHGIAYSTIKVVE